MGTELTTSSLLLIIWLDGIEAVGVELADESGDLRGATNAEFGVLVAETRSMHSFSAIAPTVTRMQSGSLGGVPNDANKFSPQR